MHHILRLGVISDAHDQVQHDGGWNQPVWIGGEDVLFERLKQWIAAKDVQLLIHCGDIIGSRGRRGETRALARLAGLGVPVLAVRGNHDMLNAMQYRDWQSAEQSAPTVGMGDRLHREAQADLFLLNNQWIDQRNVPVWHWDTSPVGWFSDRQLAWLDSGLAADAERPAVVVMHYPIDFVPPYPVPAALQQRMFEHSKRVSEVLNRHPRARVVASGHFHRTSACISSGRVHVTTAAFCEAPFDVRLIEIGPARISIDTHSLWRPGDPVSSDPAKAWLNGGPSDRKLWLPR